MDDGPPAPPLVSLHLFTLRAGAVPAGLWRAAADRSTLRRMRGVRFAKIVGTGSGQTFTRRDADLRRWGIVAAWDDQRALDGFGGSRVAAQWQRLSFEWWSIEMVPLKSRGTWS